MMRSVSDWAKRLAPRERLALGALAIILPVVLGWWFVTEPLLDRRATLTRVCERLMDRERELVARLQRAGELRRRIASGQFVPDSRVVPLVEGALKTNGFEGIALTPETFAVGDTRGAAAGVRAVDRSATEVVALAAVLASEGYLVAEFDLGPQPTRAGLNVQMKIWTPGASEKRPN